MKGCDAEGAWVRTLYYYRRVRTLDYYRWVRTLDCNWEPGFEPSTATGMEGVDPARALVAQWIAHKTSNLGVVGSNPTGGAFARRANGLVA